MPAMGLDTKLAAGFRIDLEHDDAGAHGIEAQLVGKARREIADRDTLEGIRAGEPGDAAFGYLGQGRGFHRNLDPIPVAQHGQRHALAGGVGGNPEAQRAIVGHVFAVDLEDHVTGPEAGAGGRSIGIEVADEHAAGAVEPQGLGKVRGHRLTGKSEPGTHDLALVEGGAEHGAHHAGGDREADTAGVAGTGVDRRVDADDLAREGNERAARIAGIDGGVGLQEEAVVIDADLRACGGRDDARGHRLSDAEGVADGEHDIAHFGVVLFGKRGLGEGLVPGFQAQHRKIGAGIGEHHLGVEFASVGEHDLDHVRLADDVIVGDDDAFRAHDDAGAERALEALAGNAEAEILAEKAAHEGAVEERAAHRHHSGGVDVDDRRRYFLHHRRIGEQDLAPALGELPHKGRRRAALLGHGRSKGGEQKPYGGQQVQAKGHGGSLRLCRSDFSFSTPWGASKADGR